MTEAAHRTVNGVFREEFVSRPKTLRVFGVFGGSDSLFPLFPLFPLFSLFSSVWIFSPRLNLETIFGRFLPAMNLISSARDHRVILACVI
jgi:hypothetical protein